MVKVETNLGDMGRAVHVSGDLYVFPCFTASTSDPALPFDVKIEAEYEDGRFRVQKLIATPRPKGIGITTDGLRQIPVGRIMKAAVESVLFQGKWGSNIVDWGPAVMPKRDTFTGPDDEALQLVSAYYMLAAMVGVPPRTYVADQLGIPRSTASRWIALARAAKYLEPRKKEGEGP
jgi:hypothetical protein